MSSPTRTIPRPVRRIAAVAVALLAMIALAAPAGAQEINFEPPAVDPGRYLVGDTAYFSVHSWNCSIRPNGDVGCDIPGGAFMVQVPFAPKVYDVAIDLPFLPAHPTFGIGGPQGRAGSPELTGTLHHAGVKCTFGFKGAFSCHSKGHSFGCGRPPSACPDVGPAGCGVAEDAWESAVEDIVSSTALCGSCCATVAG